MSKHRPRTGREREHKVNSELWVSVFFIRNKESFFEPEVLYDIFDLENVNMLKINYIYPYFEMTSS